MDNSKKALSDFERSNLLEACTREAKRIGGDDRCAEYFFVRAQSSRVRFSPQGEVTVADMEIKDWCAAIAWSAPGVGRPPKRAAEKETSASIESDPQDHNSEPELSVRKEPRMGAHYRSSSSNAA